MIVVVVVIMIMVVMVVMVVAVWGTHAFFTPAMGSSQCSKMSATTVSFGPPV
jgi:hypothetical protein